MQLSRFQFLIVIAAVIMGWVLADELTLRVNSSRAQQLLLSSEAKRLVALSRNSSLPAQVASAEVAANTLRGAAYTGTTIAGARAQLANDLQRLLASHANSGALFRLSRASSTDATKPDKSTNLPEGFFQEAFAVSGTFTPALLVQLTQDLSSSSRLVRVEGLSVKGNRFELFGSAVLQVTPRVDPKVSAQ